MMPTTTTTTTSTTMGNALKSGLGHGYSPAVQVLLQTLVEFCKPPKLQLSHWLLLALAIIVAADLVWAGHDGGSSVSAEKWAYRGEGKEAVRGRRL
jgi:hypothetical protein